MNKLEPLKPKLSETKKVKYSKSEMEFLTQYAYTNNKTQSMIRSGCGVKKSTGELYNDKQIIERANNLLSTKFAQDYVMNMQRKVREQNVFTLDRAFNEVYDQYITLKEQGKWHEANITLGYFLQIGGFLKPNVAVQQQFVTDKEGGINITYVQPPDKKE